MIRADTYKKRRATLAKKIKHPIVLTAHTAVQQRADMAHRFTQEASFFYLTGINEPDWLLLYDGSDWQLAQPSLSDTHKIFDGQLEATDARKHSGVSSVISNSDADALLKAVAKKHKEVATIGKDPYAKHYDFSLNPAQATLRRRLKKIFSEVIDCRMELRQIRALKSDDEIAEHQVAIDTTVEAFKSLKKTLKEKHFEYEVEAHFNAEFRVHGTGGHAYEPIVAGGADACTLHYVDNNARLPENGLVLIDVGTQVSGYAADITRTYAIGTPTERQRRIHKAVETAHHKIIALIKPDLTFHEYQESSDAIMKIALIEVGLLESVDDQETYRHYFPHSVSHGLGIDVHESLGGYDTFRPGMLLTVEPGIYIPEEGIGVRIEDNILVTSTGNRNLSAHLPTSL